MNGKRYASAMLLLAAVAAAVLAPPKAPASHAATSAQATAMVRIISGVELRLDGRNNSSDIPAPRDTVLTSGGVQQPAKLIEFR
jgi:hypothetical protein